MPSIRADTDNVDMQAMLYWLRRRIPRFKGSGGDSTTIERTLVVLLIVVCTVVAVVKLGNQVMASWSEVDRQLDPSASSDAE